jgi:putative ABC transport system substrate-binding protein
MLVGGGAALWVRAAAGQGAPTPTVGIVRVNAPASEQFVNTFRRDMAALGWDEGRNVRYEIRFSDGRNDRVVANVTELVARPVDVLMTFGNFATAAAQRTTTRIPIVAMSDNMVDSGLVKSWTRPEGNTTGLSIMGRELDVKRLELLHEMVPGARRIGGLVDPTITPASREAEVVAAARRFDVELVPVRVEGADDVPRALDAVIAAGVGAVTVFASPMLHAERARMIERLNQMRLPAMYEWPETAEEGGLIGYGARILRTYRQVAVMVDKVLRGAKPADLAIQQPTQFTLMINLRTARALGLAIPATLLAQADDVVE